MKYLLKKILIIGLLSSCHSCADQTHPRGPREKLVIHYAGDADDVEFKMLGGPSQVLVRDSLSGDFEGAIEIPSLEEAIFTYEIGLYKKDSMGKMRELEPDQTLIKLNDRDAIKKRDRFIWIGKKRKGEYETNEELVGSLVTESIASKFLGEERRITVYTPREVSSKVPLIYFTDGGIVEIYAPYIDYLISTNRIQPIVLIGVHSSRSNRYKEYVKGVGTNELFRKHQAFFYKEVLAVEESKIKDWRGQRYLYGYSNGAAFCMHEGINNPGAFSEIIAFSTADYISELARWLNPIKFTFDAYPKFYMGAGRYEESIFKSSVEFVDVLKANEVEVDFKEFISGHDSNVWRIEFLEYVENQFRN